MKRFMGIDLLPLIAMVVAAVLMSVFSWWLAS